MAQYISYSSRSSGIYPSGVIPTGEADNATPKTSATTTFVNAITTTVTLTQTAQIQAIANATFTTTTAASVAGLRITINSVASRTGLVTLTALATNYIGTVQALSASLAPGTYTVNFDFQRSSGTGTVNYVSGTLVAVGLQGTNSNGITQLTGALQAGPGSGSQVLTGTLPVTNGGTGLSSTTINRILYSSANNVIGQIATANTGALVTSSSGVPSIASGATANRLLRTNGTTVSFAQAALTTDVSGILPGANGGTGTTMFASGRIPFSNGTTYAADALFIYNSATNQFTVGNGAGTGKISSVVLTTDPNPNLIAGNFYSRTTGNVAVEIQNENTLPTLDMTNSGGAVGANILAEYSRGTLVARTQALSGDTLFSLTAHGRAVSNWSAGYGATMSVVASENVTDTTNGAEWVFSATPNGAAAPIERLRILNSGQTQLTNSHLKSTQTTAPTIAATANAGTGATASLARATDVAGEITLNSGTGSFSAGALCTITFNVPYSVAPIVMLTPANDNAAQDFSQLHQTYVSSTTTDFSVNFGIQPNTSGKVYIWNYHVIETQ